jgi:hypothetical protein
MVGVIYIGPEVEESIVKSEPIDYRLKRITVTGIVADELLRV